MRAPDRCARGALKKTSHQDTKKKDWLSCLGALVALERPPSLRLSRVVLLLRRHVGDRGVLGAIRLAGHRPLATEMEARLTGVARWPGAAWGRNADHAAHRRPLQGRGAGLQIEAVRLADHGILADVKAPADLGG